MDLIHYEILASVFDFPQKNYAGKVHMCLRMLEDKYPDLANQFRPFQQFVDTEPAGEVEKIYMRTFDIQALCCMDVGYVLYGEDYTRGKILAYLNKEHNEFGIDCHGELADRLPNILRLLAKHTDNDFIKEMVVYLLKPGLDKMIAEFVPTRLREKEHIYMKFHKTVLDKKTDQVTKFRIPLMVAKQILDIDFPTLAGIGAGNKDYMDSVKGEMMDSLKENKF